MIKFNVYGSNMNRRNLRIEYESVKNLHIDYEMY